MISKPIISKMTRIRYPEHFEIGDYSVVDDFCYFATKIKVGMFCHIAPQCSCSGGLEYTITIQSMSAFSAGVKAYCSTNDFVKGLVTVIPNEYKHVNESNISGDITLERFTGIGANSVIMPNNHILEGVTIGALSFVPYNFQFKPWTVYAGSPIKPIKARDKRAVLREANLLSTDIYLYGN